MTPTPAENSSADRAGNNRELLAEVLSEVPLLGKLLAKIVLQRRWGLVLAILLIGWFFLVYPLLVPIIAATLINAGVLREWHQPYAESVRTAFRVEELAGRVATLGNQRLDYFQVVEVVARNANQLHTYSFSVQPNQRVRFRKEEATVYSTDPVRCAVPRELLRKEAKLFTLRVQDLELMDLDNGTGTQSVEITPAQWETMHAKLDSGRLAIRIVPVEALLNVECEALKADVRLTVEVFKDLVTAPAAVAKAGGG